MNGAAAAADDEERKGDVAEAATAATNDRHATAEPQRQAAHGSRYVGQRDEQERLHGFGCEVDAAGRMIEGRYGVWSHGLLLEYRMVPLSLRRVDCFIKEGALGEEHVLEMGRYERGRLTRELVVFADGSTYEGEFNFRGQRHGVGTLAAKNGCESAGTWRNGELTLGKRTFVDGRKEQGTFFDDKLHGTDCVIVESNGDLLVGTARHGLFTAGTLTQPTGTVFKGSWGNSGFEEGVVTIAPSRETHQGTWLNGKLHGPACIVEWPNGDRYEGGVRQHKNEGLGKFTRKESGKVYAGEWSNDKRAGFGVEMDRSASILECGVWKDNLLVEGRPVPLAHLRGQLLDQVFIKARERGAILLRERDEWYRGAVDDDQQPHGEGWWFHSARLKQHGIFEHGSLTKGFAESKNGDTFDGEWKDGKRHGKGRNVRKSDGVISKGIWSLDKLVSGKRTFPDKQTQQGTFVDDQLHGESCILVLADGDRYDGAMHQGRRQGVGKQSWPESGEAYEGQWINDRRSGFGMQRRRDGKIIACGRWVDDALRESCPVPRLALLKGTLPHADDALLMPDGCTFRGRSNDDHQPHGQGSMFRGNDNEESRGNWVDGSLTGLGLLRYPNGDVFEGQLKAGKRKGFGMLWDKKGNLLKCGEWGNGWLREVDSRSVPRRFIPFGDKLNALTQTASLFFPSGEFFVGELSGPNKDQPHGEGKMYWPHAVVKEEGVWSNGVCNAAARRAPMHVVILRDPPSLPASPPQSNLHAMDIDSEPDSRSRSAMAAQTAASAMSAVACPPRRRNALCVSNNKTARPLKTPSCWTDAERMSRALQGHKMESLALRDLDHSAMDKAFDAWISSLKQQQYGLGDLAVLYFSGHGCEIGPGNVYLLPTHLGEEDANPGGLSVRMLKRKFNRDLQGVQVVLILECSRVSRRPPVQKAALDRARRQQQQQPARFQRERHQLANEEYAKRMLQQAQMPEPAQPFLRRHDDYSTDSGQSSPILSTTVSEEPQSSSSSSSSLPAARRQAAIPPHVDDVTRNHFAVVYACDTGHIALADEQGGGLFTTLLLEQMQSADADLSIVGLLGRTNRRMGEVTAPLGRSQVASAEISPTVKETFTLAMQLPEERADQRLPSEP